MLRDLLHFKVKFLRKPAARVLFKTILYILVCTRVFIKTIIFLYLFPLSLKIRIILYFVSKYNVALFQCNKGSFFIHEILFFTAIPVGNFTEEETESISILTPKVQPQDSSKEYPLQRDEVHKPTNPKKDRNIIGNK